MKIEVEIPDWAFGKPIYVIAGTELLAYRQPIVRHKNGKHETIYGPTKIKTYRCEGCGECCADCVFVRSDGCPFKEQIPLSCVVSDCSKYENCTERFVSGLES